MKYKDSVKGPRESSFFFFFWIVDSRWLSIYSEPNRYSELTHFLMAMSLNPSGPSLLGPSDHSSPGLFCSLLRLTLVSQPWLLVIYATVFLLSVTFPDVFLRRDSGCLQSGSSSSGLTANSQRMFAHLWPPLRNEKHQMLPRYSAVSCAVFGHRIFLRVEAPVNDDIQLGDYVTSSQYGLEVPLSWGEEDSTLTPVLLSSITWYFYTH